MIPGSANPLLLAGAAEEAGYAIERSLRFNSSDSAYLYRDFSSTGTSLTTSTISLWVKFSSITTENYLFTAGSDTSNYFVFSTNTSSQIRVFTGENGATNLNLTNTTAVFRDPSAWYHLVLQLDWSNAVSTDRIKLYVNGTRITLTGTFASQGYTGTRLNRAFRHSIGRHMTGASYLNGYLADVHFIDGQALDPTSFGEFDADTGIWNPIEYTGSYGTNGFHLPFSDNSSAAALGDDTSGNNNDWSVNNISVASGAGNDSLIDVPQNGTETDSGAGGEVRGNYATLNPLGSALNGQSFSNGNLEITGTHSNETLYFLSTIKVSSGKYYVEYDTFNVNAGRYTYGITEEDYMPVGAAAERNNGVGILGYAVGANSIIAKNTVVQTPTADTRSGIWGVAADFDNNQLSFFFNGVQVGTTISITAGNYAFAASQGTDLNRSFGVIANFGARPFAYTAPSGFKALNTASLPAPTVENGSDYMDVALYTGNGSTQTISGLGFSPDFVWTKARSFAENNNVFDTVRGVTKLLLPDSTNADQTISGITSFNSDGYTVGSHVACNSNGQTYVSWNWDAGSSTVSNTDGSITSSVRANPTAGFSISTWTSNGASSIETVGHSLGVTPALIIAKGRGPGTSSNWHVWSNTFSNQVRDYLYLNSTAAKTTAGVDIWSTSSTTFGIRQSSIAVNNDGCVAYCFAPVEGYSAFGSYTGNGSTDGPFVFTGMRPRWVLIRRTDSGNDWQIFDTARNEYNETVAVLIPNTSAAEVNASTNKLGDVLSNGFKLRASGAGVNASSGTYIYAAFAENPFALNARAR